MADIIKKQIVDRLSRYTKGLKPKDISLQFLSGKGQLKDLELNPDFLTQVLMFPPWLEISSAKCDLIRCRVPFTKIRSEPIVVSINEVVVEVNTCSSETKKEKVDTGALQKMRQKSSGSYGIIDKAVDGMTIEIRSVQLRFTDPAFCANLLITEISIRSVPPPKQQASSLRDMFLKLKQEEAILFYKHLKMHSLRIEGWGTSAADGPLRDPALQLRLLMNETVVNLAVKRRLVDTSVMFVKVVAHLGDLMWILTQSQLRALSKFAQSLTEAALKTFHKEREEKSKMQKSKVPSAAPGGMTGAERKNPFEGANLSNVTRWLQQIYQEGKKHIPEWEVIQHSLHLLTRDVNIQLCSDMSEKDDDTVSSRITGSTLLHVENLEIDVYPDQMAGTGRCHWRGRNEIIDDHLTWARELLSEASHIKVPIATPSGSNTPSSRASESDGPPPRPELPPSALHHRRSIDSGGPPPRPEAPPQSLLNRKSTYSAASHSPPTGSYTSEDLDDDDAVLITSPIESFPLSNSSSSEGNQGWRGSTASLQSLDLTPAEGVKYSRVRMSRLRERNIVIRCKRFTIDALSTFDGKVSPLPFLRSDKDTFHLPDEVSAFQICITLYYYPGHTMGKESLVPRPVIKVEMCPVHFILNQPTCLWLIDFVQGIVRTIDFDLANRVRKDIEHTLRQRKEKKAALYPLPTALEGFHFKFRILYTKITLPVYSGTSLKPPQDGRPVALQVETSDINLSTLSKASLDESQEFKNLLEPIQSGWLFAKSELNAFPHVHPTDLSFLPHDCLSTILESQGISSVAHTDRGTSEGMKVAVNEGIGLGSPWNMACECICVRFVHDLNEMGVTQETSPFISDFPVTAWLFPGVKEVADTFSSGSDILGDDDALPFPSVSALVHIRHPIAGKIARPELMTCLRLKDSITEFKDGIIKRMLPMKEKVKAGLAQSKQRGSVSSEHSHSVMDLVYVGGAVVASGASFRLILPPLPSEGKASAELQVEEEGRVHSAQEGIPHSEQEEIVQSAQDERQHSGQEGRQHSAAEDRRHNEQEERTHREQESSLESGTENCKEKVPNNVHGPNENYDGCVQSSERTVNDCEASSASDELVGSSSASTLPPETEPATEVVSLKVDVTGIAAIFTLSQPGITVKAGVHEVALEDQVVDETHRESPIDTGSDRTAKLSDEPILKARVEVGDQVKRLFRSDLEKMPNGLTRLEVSGLGLSMVQKHLAGIAAFATDEVPSQKPMPLEVHVKNTGFTMKDLHSSRPDGLKSMRINVTDALIVRGPRAIALYPEGAQLEDGFYSSISTLADELMEPANSDTLQRVNETVPPEIKEFVLGKEEETAVETGQDKDLLEKFQAFVEEFQSYLARPGQPRMPRAPEFLALLDGMRTSLASVGHGEKLGTSPPDYITATRGNEVVMQDRLNELDKERSELLALKDQLTKKTEQQEAEVGALEQALVQCKLDLAQQKELVLDKEDKIKTLKEELSRTAQRTQGQ